MKSLFPEVILKLPLANISLHGVKSHLFQGLMHQILFMEFENDIVLPEHSHEAQYGIVLEGRIDITINNELRSYFKGDRYYIPAGVRHSSQVFAGYSDITFFNSKDRYKNIPK